MSNPLDRRAQQTISALVRLGREVVQAPRNKIEFIAIPPGYNSLRLDFNGRDTGNVGEAFVLMQFNDDATSGNYTSAQYVAGSATSASANLFAASANGLIITAMPGTLNNANAFSTAIITMPGYTNILFHKNAMAQTYELFGTTPTRVSYLLGATWKSFAPISKIVLTCGNTAFAPGTNATLYGIV